LKLDGEYYRAEGDASALLSEPYSLPTLISAPLDIQHLILRTAILPEANRQVLPWTDWSDSLPPAAEAISQFTSSASTQHLTISVNIGLRTPSDLAEIDLSPLKILRSACLSIPHVDLYVHTGILPSALTRDEIFLSLEDKEDILRSIDEGVLVIHLEKRIPE
jgi:hypothetical protein